MKLTTIVALAAIAATPALAQLAAPNAAGVSLGHIHLLVHDVNAQRQFWIMLGGKDIKDGQREMFQFAGVFIALRKGEPAGGTVGSNVNHFGFHVQSVADTLVPIRNAGFKIEQNNPQQAFVTGPDDVRVELLEDKTIPGPIAMHHVHMFVTSPLDVQAWYVKNFGAVAGKRGAFDTANLPGGVEISLSKTDAAQVPTKGRAVDHIGFEVKNLDAFVKKLEAQGVKLDDQPHMAPNTNVKIAFLTDPWGTYIELTQGISPQI
jgi:catechol 2,3-dioxygenase-like lactoylglutathione lyase family enzyme